MKNSKKAWIFFRRTILLLFVLFLINYYQVESGNYRNEVEQKTIITEEKIREFENDVKNGNFVDIKDYTEENSIDTSTPLTDLGYNIGNELDNILNDKVAKFFNYIGSFFK